MPIPYSSSLPITSPQPTTPTAGSANTTGKTAYSPSLPVVNHLDAYQLLQQPAPTPAQNEQQISKNLNPVQNFGLGLAKGVGSTLYNLGTGTASTVNDIGHALGASSDILPSSVIGGDKHIQDVKDTLQPQGTGQNIGFFTEKGAEFLAPSSIVTKTQGAITGAIDALPLGQSLLAQGAKV